MARPQKTDAGDSFRVLLPKEWRLLLDSAASLSEGRSANELAAQFILSGLLQKFEARSVSDALDVAIVRLEAKKVRDPAARLRNLLLSSGEDDREPEPTEEERN